MRSGVAWKLDPETAVGAFEFKKSGWSVIDPDEVSYLKLIVWQSVNPVRVYDVMSKYIVGELQSTVCFVPVTGFAVALAESCPHTVFT